MSASDASTKTVAAAADVEALVGEMEGLGQTLSAARGQIARVIYGQEAVVEQCLVAILSGGHALLVGVPGLIPEREFFAHLAQRRFPVTVWMRRRDEFDYLVEPDLFHDFFGHVPLLCDPVYADFIELYGRAGPRAIEHGGLAMLARLYWYGVEFGLMETSQGLRAYGAGILSSAAETRYAIESPRPLRIRFELERVLRTRYLIDDFQRNYFVIRSFRELIDQAVQTDFLPLYARHADEPGIEPGTWCADDVLLQPVPGTSGTAS